MYDYEFTCRTFDGGSYLYTQRFDKLLSDKELNIEMGKIIEATKNTKSIILNRVINV